MNHRPQRGKVVRLCPRFLFYHVRFIVIFAEKATTMRYMDIIMRHTLYIMAIAGAVGVVLLSGCKARQEQTQRPHAVIGYNDDKVKAESAVADESAEGSEIAEMPAHVLGGSASHLPMAVVYRTSGDYDDNVTVTLDGTRQRLLSYPDPSDVGDWSTPVKLADGWLLDRRGGVGENTVFLSWTYRQYHDLPTVPTQEDLLRHVIPGARVIAAYRLPVRANEADTAVCNGYIRDGFRDCTPLLYMVRARSKK